MEQVLRLLLLRLAPEQDLLCRSVHHVVAHRRRQVGHEGEWWNKYLRPECASVVKYDGLWETLTHQICEWLQSVGVRKRDDCACACDPVLSSLWQTAAR